jgi:hypothetical protein
MERYLTHTGKILYHLVLSHPAASGRRTEAVATQNFFLTSEGTKQAIPWCCVLLETLTSPIKKFSAFKEPEDPLSCSKKPTTGPYCHTRFLQDTF